jgi:hypothetical protein
VMSVWVFAYKNLRINHAVVEICLLRTASKVVRKRTNASVRLLYFSGLMLLNY